MPRAKAIFAMIKQVRGKNRGKVVKRYFKSEAERTKSLANYAKIRGQIKTEVKTALRKKTVRLHPLSVPEKHQLNIARKTLKMPGPMAGVMGGMTKKEAAQILRKFGR